MKTLNVKKTSLQELKEQWGFEPILLIGREIYIRCNAKGEINWDVAPVYSHDELIERNDVNILYKTTKTEQNEKRINLL
ncbi:MAG: hypothetical protein ACUZ8H_01565 [Candidatus Anammoxibacter sp.]